MRFSAFHLIVLNLMMSHCVRSLPSLVDRLARMKVQQKLRLNFYYRVINVNIIVATRKEKKNFKLMGAGRRLQGCAWTPWNLKILTSDAHIKQNTPNFSQDR